MNSRESRAVDAEIAEVVCCAKEKTKAMRQPKILFRLTVCMVVLCLIAGYFCWQELKRFEQIAPTHIDEFIFPLLLLTSPLFAPAVYWKVKMMQIFYSAKSELEHISKKYPGKKEAEIKDAISMIRKIVR